MSIANRTNSAPSWTQSLGKNARNQENVRNAIKCETMAKTCYKIQVFMKCKIITKNVRKCKNVTNCQNKCNHTENIKWNLKKLNFLTWLE